MGYILILNGVIAKAPDLNGLRAVFRDVASGCVCVRGGVWEGVTTFHPVL